MLMNSGKTFGEILIGHDCVLILSWSKWDSERPSNRWHYARRLNKHKVVFFINLPNGSSMDIKKMRFEHTDFDFYIITPPEFMPYDRILELTKEYLTNINLYNPLVWIYNSFYQNFKNTFSNSFVVYHATEDYFEENVFPDSSSIRNSILNASDKIDLWVFCSLGVRDSFEIYLDVKNHIYLPNGVDYNFFSSETSIPRNNSVAYQGNIDDRIDFGLVYDVVKNSPDCEFNFYGPANTKNKIWKLLLEMNNVNFFDNIDISDLQLNLSQDGIAWIPFHINDYNYQSAFPLKYFEYLASGLPVVSVPMIQISLHNPRYIFANNSKDFITIIKELLETTGSELREELKSIASMMDYDKRFSELLNFHLTKKENVRINALLVIDTDWMNISSVREHVVGLKRNLGVSLATIDVKGNRFDLIDHTLFDILIIHFSVRFNQLIDSTLQQKMVDFDGFKVLFMQDDYDNPNLAVKEISTIKFNLVLTSAPKHLINQLYPSKILPETIFISVLSGYVSEDMFMYQRFWNKVSYRKNMIVYRGRDLPPRYGKLGAQKKQIADLFVCFLRNLAIEFDISYDSNKRIFDKWISFLMSGRATLITESGSSIIDWDGKLRLKDELLTTENRQNRYIEFELSEPWNCISPRVFEAIAVGTVLVGYKGYYSGVIQEKNHYLALEHDHSNIEEIISTLKESEEVERMRNKAFEEIILNYEYSYNSLCNLIMQNYFDNKPIITKSGIILMQQNNFLRWSMKIVSAERTKAINFKNSNHLKIPGFIPNKKITFSSLSASYRLFPWWKVLRFNIFKILISYKISRYIIRLIGKKSDRISRYLAVIN